MKENFKIVLCVVLVFFSSFTVLGLFLDAYSEGMLTSEKNIISVGGITTQNPKQVTLDVLANILGETQTDDVKINNLGFRGEEFSEIKPEGTFRIFLLGGSQMFGTGATSDKTTIPGFLQSYFEKQDNSFSIEVINSGLKGVDSYKELLLLQNMIVGFSPDMVIVYDGLNDLRAGNSSEEILDNWNAMCRIGQENNFDVIISLQPIAGFGNKILTQNEKFYVENGKDYKNNPLTDSMDTYQEYAQNLKKVQDCTNKIDFRFAFDGELDSIYIDEAHVSDNGNSIISKSILTKTSDIIPKEIISEPRSTEFKSMDPNIISEFQSVIDTLSSNFLNKLKLEDLTSFESDNFEETIQMNKFSTNTQSLVYEDTKIEIMIEISSENEYIEDGKIKISTIDKNTESILHNVTYLMTITKNGNELFTNYFFVEDEELVIQIKMNDEDIKIFGERKYELDALIMNSEVPISIVGSFFEYNSSYEFDISLRTIHDSENFIFLNGFYAEITT